MHPDWDLAHTDLDSPTGKQLPAGLAATPDHWRQRFQHTPNGHLLRPDGNAMLTALASGRPLYFEQEKAAEAWTYWNRQSITAPFNSSCGPKGEIGVNPATPLARVTVWTAEQCSRGFLHPIERVAAVPAPRLVPWLVAHLRDRTEEERWNNRSSAPA
ncbi:hypothetical protein ACFVUY_30995 [Kitasatospora sp. NPDC058063]|uniref:hypothetical protein n=1 Tax=unclassified Kitasatospora TaxID=2633591 RepID=UPI0036DE51C0